MVIDAHQHFWRLGQFDTSWLDVPAHEPIRRDFLPGHLKPLMDSAGVEKSVVVQTQHDRRETRWLLELADEHPWIAGVVGWVDLTSPDCEQQLAEFTAHPKFVGVRHITQDEPEDDYIVRQDVIGGLKVLERQGVPFDLLFYLKHLRHAAVLGEMLQELPMVIDHLAKPHIKDGAIENWEPNLRTAARHENIFCKLSGLVTEAHWSNWTPVDLRPYVEIAVDAFGPERLMYGSDWPMCTLAGTYQQVFEALWECLAPLSAAERERIFGGTARDFYKLET